MSVSLTGLQTVRILSFDPGTTNMGWAISQYDTLTGDFDVIQHGVFKSSKVAKKRKGQDGKYYTVPNEFNIEIERWGVL